MEAFLKFLYDVLRTFFLGLYHTVVNGFIGFFEVINIKSYINAFDNYSSEFNSLGWVLAIFVIINLIAILLLIGFLVYLLVRKIIRIVKSSTNEEVLLDEVGKLNKEIFKLSKEKDRILELQTGGINGYNLAETEEVIGGLENNEINNLDYRFYKLHNIDLKYENYDPLLEDFNTKISLKKLVDNFRNYACSKLGLYYDIKTIRLFISSLGASRIIILQGISGTGKTSLPYAFGRFIANPTLISPVEPSWKDKSDFLGYFNEFTKKFNETEILRNLYEATYTDKIYLTVLDEMNISRVEYYFAEMLSILEMPSSNDWVIDVAPNSWDNDPIHLVNGKLNLSNNIWFIGTANHDDSTFAIADKVYDRAIPITINNKGMKFNAPLTQEESISASFLLKLYEKAKIDYEIESSNLEKLEELDSYLIDHFRITFGNRILKQISEFVPIYKACGGKEIEAIDYLVCFKILRKFEMQNLSFIREELDDFVKFLNLTFGENEMSECLAYINRLNNKK